MRNKKEFILNIIGQIIVFSSNMIISLFLTPYVLEKLGTEAYGFIGLINSFVSYISIVTIALNALAGRYITLSYYKGEKEASEEYYSSVFFANLFLSVLVFLAASILLLNISDWIKIPTLLLQDVCITIILSAINTVISLISVVYGIAAFIKNKLYLNSLSQVVSAFARVALIIMLFVLLEAHMWYYTIAAILASMITLIIQRDITKKLCPEFTITKSKVKLDRILEIIRVGIWVSIENFNKILQTGLDLLIANIFINADATGILSLAKTVPNVLVQITGMIATTFQPELAQIYASGKTTELLKSFRYTIRALSTIMIVPLIGIIVFGKDFYTLWLPTQTMENIELIQDLSVLTVLPLLINAYVEGLYFANTLTGKVKGSVLFSLVFSVLSIVIEFILLRSLSINPLYIIAGTSSLFMIIRYILVTPLYSAYVLGIPPLSFYPSLLWAIAVSILVYVGFYWIEKIIVIHTWIQMLMQCALSGILGYIFVIFTLFNKRERKQFLLSIRDRLQRRS